MDETMAVVRYEMVKPKELATTIREIVYMGLRTDDPDARKKRLKELILKDLEFMSISEFFKYFKHDTMHLFPSQVSMYREDE